MVYVTCHFIAFCMALCECFSTQMASCCELDLEPLNNAERSGNHCGRSLKLHQISADYRDGPDKTFH